MFRDILYQGSLCGCIGAESDVFTFFLASKMNKDVTEHLRHGELRAGAREVGRLG